MRDLSRNVQITKQYESPETSPGRPNDHDGSLMFTSAAAHKHDGRTNERRSCNREPLQWAVLVFFGDNWGKLIDLSEKGMCFQFAHAPAVGESVHFSFEAMGCMPLPHDGKIFGDAIQATGRVVWALEFERTAGVQFLELSPRSRDQIRYWMSSVPSQEVVPKNQEAHGDWTNEAAQEAPAPFPATATAAPAPTTFSPPEPAAHFAHSPFGEFAEISESHLENQVSDSEVVWEPDPSFSSHRHAPEEPAPELPRRHKSVFMHSPEPPASEPELPVDSEPEPRLESGPESGLESGPESGFEPEREPLPSESEGFWQSRSAPAPQQRASLGLEGFEAGLMGHEERQRRGQTLELRQRRARVGYAAVLSFLATVGAVAGIIGFISRFNGGAEVAGDASRPSAGQVDSGRAQEPTAAENTSPFLVEVLDTNNRRSVLWFSNEAHTSTAIHAVRNSSEVLARESFMQLQYPQLIRQVKATAIAKQKSSHDFSLAPPHASETTASSDSSAAPVAPALPGEVPASADMPLKETLPNPAMPEAERIPPTGGDVQPARLIKATLPIYPPTARANRTAGDVTLDAFVDESGNVRDLKVISGPILLREAAKDAVRRWKYEPARLDGRPAAMHLTVTVKFKTNGEIQ